MDMSDAIKEAYAHAPADVTYYDTLEISHDSFTDNIRVVISDTPLSTPQGEFIACPNVQVRLPEIDGCVQGQLEITIGMLPKKAQIALKDASTTTSPISIKYRQYIAEDVDPDAELPVPLQVDTIKQTHIQAIITAAYPDLVNARFPRRLMTTTVLPGGVS